MLQNYALNIQIGIFRLIFFENGSFHVPFQSIDQHAKENYLFIQLA